MALLNVTATVSRNFSAIGRTAPTISSEEYWLKGEVTVSATPHDALIRVYRKDTGALLASGRSSEPLGTFSVSWLGYSGSVYWMAFDDRGSPVYNAKVRDLVSGIQ